MITLRQVGPQGLRRLLAFAHAAEARKFEGGERKRKRDFAARLLIDAERHKQLIHRRLIEVYENEQVRAAIGKHVDHRRNLEKRLADRIAVAYNTPPVRTIRGDETATQRFAAAYKEAKTATKAPRWGRMAWLCNVVHVLPRVEEKKLRWVHVLPHCADAVFDPAGEDEPSILIYETSSRGAARVAVDSERWWWLDQGWEIIADEEHGVGARPWAQFRVAAPPEDDYWDRGRGQNVIDGTIEVARLSAHMGWARKINSKPTPYLFVDEDAELPGGQVLNGEEPLYVRGNSVKFGVAPTVVDPADFEQEMRSIVEDVCESQGVPSTVVDFEPGSTSDAANVFAFAGPRTHAQLVKVRNDQIKHLTEGEEELAKATAAELRRTGHPGAISEESAELIRVRFADLSFADHPKAQIETALKEMELGHTDPYAAYLRRHPGITAAEAREAVDGHVDARAVYIETLTSRNLTMGAKGDAQTLAQMQGARGGRMAANDNTNPDGNIDAAQ